MCKQECPSADHCMLLDSLRNQATAGGYKDRALTSGGNGPYWPRDSWDRQMRDSRRIAEKVGCFEKGTVRKETVKTTAKKLFRRQLVD